jgi:hypothetical protein
MIEDGNARRRADFASAKKALEGMTALNTTQERFAVCRRFERSVRALLSAGEIRSLDKTVGTITTTREVEGFYVPVINGNLSGLLAHSVRASLRRRSINKRYTPGSTIDLAVRQYAKRIDLPLRSHTRGPKSAAARQKSSQAR